MVRVTSARPSAGRPAVPAKMTSSILPPRRLFAPCSPRTQAMASTTLDLPEPLGPTTAVMPGSRRRVVGDAKDLKPFSVRLERCTGPTVIDQARRAASLQGPRRAQRGVGGKVVLAQARAGAGDSSARLSSSWAVAGFRSRGAQG